MIQNLYLKLRRLNVSVREVDGRLEIKAANGILNNELLNEIKSYKDELISLINSYTKKKNVYHSINPVGIQPDYELSSAQRRLWVLSQFAEGARGYNAPGAYIFEGELDVAVLTDSFLALIGRHESLRTVFRTNEKGEVRQLIRSIEETGFLLGYHDLRGEPEELLNESVQKEFVKGFDLSTGPLVRASLYRVTDTKWVLAYVMHHIISDGWSMDILTRELLLLYNSIIKGEEDPLVPLRIQYKDYAAWQQEQLTGEKLAEHRTYWLQQLSGESPVPTLPTDKIRPAVKTYNGASVTRLLNKRISKGIKEIIHEQGSTLFMGLIALVDTLIYRYTGQEDIITGTTITGREHADLEDQIGFYVNTLALRTKLHGENSYRQLLENIKQVTLGAYAHQVYPFDELVNELHSERDISRHPLFDVLIELQHSNTNTGKKSVNLQNVRVSSYSAKGAGASKFDLRFVFSEAGEGLELMLEYNTDLYNRETIERWTGHLEGLLQAIVSAPGKAIDQLEYMSAEEKDQVLVSFNEIPVNKEGYRGVPELFAEQVLHSAGSEAVRYKNNRVSYAQLDEQSNRLANYLCAAYAIKPGSLVGIMLDRSEKMIIALLGILKAGAAYVPIDPSYPKSRKEFILNDTGIQVLLTQTDYVFDLDYYQGNVFAMDVQLENIDASAKPCDIIIYPDNLAYVIYTSGSTGQPKGCSLTHGNLSNYIQWANGYYFNENAKADFGLYTSLSFDLTVTSIFCSLTLGSRLLVYDQHEELQSILQNSFSAESGISSIKLTPSHIQLLQHLDIHSVTMLCAIVGGEDVTPEQVSILKRINPAIRIYNEYGPTEATVGCIVEELQENKPVLIGKPIAGTTIYILDEKKNLCPIGIPGEIGISGAGLAKGYLNKPALTTEKFINNPFKEKERIYLTGDMGRWLPDGTIKFTGRKDNQVKIRGHRVELAEIENVLQGHNDIETAVVIVTTGKNDDKNLVSYFTGSISIDITALQTYLGKMLPAYMIPGYFIQLDVLPLTTNGKIDRKALPDPEGLTSKTEAEYMAPRSETEEKLVLIWQEILNRETIGIKGNFFTLGGHSLKATRLASQVHKEFGVKITLQDLFTAVVLEDQARLIEQAKKTSFTIISPVMEQSDYPLSSSQKRLWILSRFEQASIGYNIPGAYVLKGKLDIPALSGSFTKLIERHESLRTVFRENNEGEVRQVILPPEQLAFFINYNDLRAEEEKEQKIAEFFRQEAAKPFDLPAGPLIRAAICQMNEQEWVFGWVMHHIISDGWSMEILIREIFSFYNSYVRGETYSLPPLGIQYKDYAAWQQQQLAGQDLAKQKAYWMKQLEGPLPILQLPPETLRPLIKTYKGDTLLKIIGHEISEDIKKLCQDRGGTLFMGLLAAVNALLYRYTNQEDIIVGTPIAGRDHADLDSQIGVYTNTLALRARFSGKNSYNELFDVIKQVTLDAYENQLYPFDELVDELRLHRDPSRHYLFDIMISLQNSGNKNEEQQLDNIAIERYENDTDVVSKFDMSFLFAETTDGIGLNITYNNDLYSRDRVIRMADHLEELLKAAIGLPEIPINRLTYLSNKEQLLLEDFNRGFSGSTVNKTINALFEEQVGITPGNIAVVFRGHQLTYRALNEKANALADYLQQKYSVRSGDLIAIQSERNEWVIVAILAILKSGGAYIPIDPALPPARKDYILQNAGCGVVIDEKELEEFIQQEKEYTILNRPPINTATDLAYVVYTSGSTGRPKGVMVEHHSLINYLLAVNKFYDLSAADRVLQIADLSFDASIEQVFLALLHGASLYIAEKYLSVDGELLGDFILANEITHLHAVPALLKQVDLQKMNSLRRIVSAGESCPVFLPGTIGDKASFYNKYGPAEATISATIFRAERTEKLYHSIPIGCPLSNSIIYIMDDRQQLMPVGTIGEICIAGMGLARGYLNQPGLTAEKFISNAYRTGERMYRTGDLGRWLPDGTIEFISRKDDQVKIRGNRVETAEIIFALHGHPDIDEATVIGRKGANGETELIAYVVSKESLNVSAIRSWLSGLLPAYMLPSHYVQLDRFPLLFNGKLDKNALPEPDLAGLPTGTEYAAPRNEIEEKLILVWQEILGREGIGINDNFFDLGGHSLKAIRVAGQVHKIFEVNVSINSIFESPTIASLSDSIRADKWIENSKNNKKKNRNIVEV